MFKDTNTNKRLNKKKCLQSSNNNQKSAVSFSNFILKPATLFPPYIWALNNIGTQKVFISYSRQKLWE